MAILGEIQIAKAIGRVTGRGYTKFIWHACPLCGKERWVQMMGGKPVYTLCLSCSRKGNYNAWRGGVICQNGYIRIFKPEHPRAIGKYVKRAILVLEEKLGRPLLPNMDSHHKNEIKDDDRPENLEEKLHGEHLADHHREYLSQTLSNEEAALP